MKSWTMEPATARRVKTQKPGKPDTKSSEVSNDYRKGVKESLQESFEQFLNDANREELSFLEGVMEMRGANMKFNRPAAPKAALIASDEEIWIASTFNYQIGQGTSVVIVPEYLAKAVAAYVKQLQSEEDKPSVPEAAPPFATEIPQSPLIASLKASLEEMDTFDLELLDTFIKAAEKNRGSLTPAEDFIEDIVLDHKFRPLTLEAAEMRIEEFRENFDDAVWIARRMTAIHPELVAAAE